MGAVLVVIGNILREQTLQMALIQGDHVVEQVMPTALDPPL